MGIEFGRPDTTWERYQLYTYPILWNGKDTGYRAVVQRDELKSIVGKAYSVVPHEWVKETTENVFKELGLSLVGEQTYPVPILYSEENDSEDARVKRGGSLSWYSGS